MFEKMDNSDRTVSSVKFLRPCAMAERIADFTRRSLGARTSEARSKRVRIPEFQVDSANAMAPSSDMIVTEASAGADEDLSRPFREARASSFLPVQHSYWLEITREI